MVKPVVAYVGTSTGYQARKLAEGCNILVATPGRLLDYVEKSEEEIELEPPSSPLRATTIMHKVRQITE